MRRWITAALQEAARKLCGGRLVALHEGGYSDVYVSDPSDLHWHGMAWRVGNAV
jgi:acetoin utilization deacetylase AcuC-like enzyme